MMSKPEIEQEAYAIQSISQELINEFMRRKKISRKAIE